MHTNMLNQKLGMFVTTLQVSRGKGSKLTLMWSGKHCYLLFSVLATKMTSLLLKLEIVVVTHETTETTETSNKGKGLRVASNQTKPNILKTQINITTERRLHKATSSSWVIVQAGWWLVAGTSDDKRRTGHRQGGGGGDSSRGDGLLVDQP